MNVRELLHFFELRCCNRAQWEIRELAHKMLELVRPTAPYVFFDARPVVRARCLQRRQDDLRKTISESGAFVVRKSETSVPSPRRRA